MSVRWSRRCDATGQRGTRTPRSRSIVDGVYQPDLRFGIEASEHGHWADRVPAMDADLAALAEELRGGGRPAEQRRVGVALRHPRGGWFGASGRGEHGHWADRVPDMEPTGALARNCGRRRVRNRQPHCLRHRIRPATPGVDHTVPESFERGEPVTLSLEVVDPAVVGATLHYRHVDQSESWRQVPMELSGQTLSGTIDGDYTASTYPLMYFFSVLHRDGGQALHPGLAADLSNQPYVVLGSATVSG